MRKTQKMKRTISLLLALVLALSLMPMAVVAAPVAAQFSVEEMDVTAVVENGNVKIDPTFGFWQTILDRFKGLEYGIVYDLNGGSGWADSAATKNTSIRPGTTFTLPNVDPEYTAHEFKGWSISSAAGSTDYWDPNTAVTYDKLDAAITSGAPANDTRTLTLYAQWDALTPKVNYTFVPTGSLANATTGSTNVNQRALLGAHADDMTTTTAASWALTGDAASVAARYGENGKQYFTREYDVGKAPGAFPVLTCPGYTFLGWSKEHDDSSFDDDSDIVSPKTSVAAAVELYGVWERTEDAKMIYKLAPGSADPSSTPMVNTDVVVEDGLQTQADDKAAIIEPTGKLGDADATVLTSGDFIRYNEWVVFTADPQAGHKIEWFVNGSPLASYSGSESFTGSTHDGDLDGTDFQSGKPNDVLAIRMPATDITVTVKYSVATWNISYELLGGSWTGNFKAPKTYTYVTNADNTVAVPGYLADGTAALTGATAPTRAGFDFAGWLPFDWNSAFDEAAGTASGVFDKFVDVDTDLTLVAMWVADTSTETVVSILPDIIGRSQPGSTPVNGANSVTKYTIASDNDKTIGEVTAGVSCQGYEFQTGSGAKAWRVFAVNPGDMTYGVSETDVETANINSDDIGATDCKVGANEADVLILMPLWVPKTISVRVEYDTGYANGDLGGANFDADVSLPADTFAANNGFASRIGTNGGYRRGYYQSGFSYTLGGSAIDRWPTAEGQTLYAVWSPVTITVNLDIRSDGGTSYMTSLFSDGTAGTAGVKSAGPTFTMGTLRDFPEVPTRSYHDFSCWTVDTTTGDGTGAKKAVFSSLDSAFIEELPGDGSSANTVTLYSSFSPKKYEINYNLANIGASFKNDTIPDAVRYYTLNSGNAPLASRELLNEPAGYRFNGWYMDKALTTPATHGEFNDEITRARDIVVYARWDVITETHWRVILEDGDNDFGTGSETVFYQGILAVSKTSNTIDINDENWTPARAGVTFTGWYTDRDCNAEDKITSTMTITADTHVYAKWERHFQVDISGIDGAASLEMATSLMATTAASISGPFDDMIITFGGGYTTAYNDDNVLARSTAGGTTQFRYASAGYIHDLSAMTGTATVSGTDLNVTLTGEVNMATKRPVNSARTIFPEDFDADGLPLKEGAYSVLSLSVDNVFALIPTFSTISDTTQVRIGEQSLTKKQLTTDKPDGMINFLIKEGETIAPIPIYIGTATTPNLTINITSEADIIEPKFTITLVAGEGGTVSGGGEVSIYGDSTIVATPNDGYEFVNWTDADSRQVAVNTTHTIENITADATITANFRERDITDIEVEYTIIFAPGSGTGSWSDLVKKEGEEVTITTKCTQAFSRKGSTFAYFEDQDGNTYPKGSKFIPTKHTVLTARYFKIKVDKVAGLKLSNTEAGKIRVRYSRTSGAAGYQVTVSTSSNFATASSGTRTLAGYVRNEITTCKGKKLAVGTTYYVRVRAYKLDPKENRVFGAYSSASIKIKK